MSVVIRVENVSKKYNLGGYNTGSLKGDFNQWWTTKVRRQEDPFAKIGEKVRDGREFWALKDVSFEIRQGEAFGIIGKNGAGKSTLLKILSRITLPTTGSIKVKGRIASLLEVGTGFNPELSGRENIYLNGAILGMTKAEVVRKFDEIVDFSGVEKFIDTPVKRYSSGMYVRLAFAVAAHLDSEILILDEVLAVGDAEFQAKCLGKMGTVTKNEGRTVLFVSHGMGAVQKLCQRAVLLQKGKVTVAGSVEQVIDKYLETSDVAKSVWEIPLPADYQELPGYAYRLQIEDAFGNPVTEIPIGKAWQVKVFFKLKVKIGHFIIALGMTTNTGVNLRTTWSKQADYEPGEYEAVFIEDAIMMTSGRYNLIIGLSSYQRVIQYIEEVAVAHISEVSTLTNDERIVNTQSGLILNPMRVYINSSVYTL